MDGLVNRNVTVAGRRTSIRLEPEMWDALAEICRREDISAHEACAVVARRRGGLSLTAAIRVYIMSYFRAAATEAGHALAGHRAASRRWTNGARPDYPPAASSSASRGPV